VPGLKDEASGGGKMNKRNTSNIYEGCREIVDTLWEKILLHPGVRVHVSATSY